MKSTCKSVWVLLSGTAKLKSNSYVGLSLEQKGAQIVAGIRFYPKRQVADETKELERLQGKQRDIPPEFCQRLSVLLQVDSDHCYDLVVQYLAHEYQGTVKEIKSIFSNDKNSQKLLHELWHFYYSERLFSLFCVKQILSYWQDSVHPYSQLFAQFLETANQEKAVLRSIVAQLKDSFTNPVPNRFSHGPHFSESFASKWMVNSLREQYELMQLLLLYFKHFKPCIEDILELFGLFEAYSSAKYIHSKQFSFFDDFEKIESIVNFVAVLQSLLIVECLQLDNLQKSMEEDDLAHHFSEDPEKLQQLDAKIREASTALQSNSVIFLGWTAVRSYHIKGLDSDSSSAVVKQLGSLSLQLKVFQVLETFLSSDQFQDLRKTVVGSVIKNTIASLFEAIFSIYGLDQISGGNLPVIYRIGCFLFDDQQVVTDLFKDVDSGLHLIVKSCFDNLPSDLTSFARVCCSLAGRHSFVSLLEKISLLETYTESFDINSPLIVPSNKECIYYLVSDRKLFGNKKLLLKKGSTGNVRRVTGAENKWLIEWQNLRLNGWTLLTHLYRERLESISGGLHSLSEVALEELGSLTDLCSRLVNSASKVLPDVQELVTLSLEGFKLFLRFQHLPRKYLASVLRFCTALSSMEESQSTFCWASVKEVNFLPYMIGLTSDFDALVAGNDTNSSIIGAAIASEECIKGEYQLCISYLSFVSASLPNLRPDSSLLAVLIHILTEILPSYSRWHYKCSRDRIEIGHLCFEVANKALSLECPPTGEGANVVNVCKSALLSNASGETLLHTIKCGNDTVRRVIEGSGSDIVLTRNEPIIMVRTSLLVLDQLLALKEKDGKGQTIGSAVEEALFKAHSVKPNMLLVLAHFVFQRYDSRLAALSIHLLKRLSKQFPMSMLACLGAEAESVRDHFLSRLEATTEDLQVKVALLEFLSVCVKYQPGLMEMFVNFDGTENGEDTNSCLRTVLDILKEKMEGEFYCPRELHVAALKFIYTFWMQPHLLAIESLKKTSILWTLICFPLFPEHEHVDSGDCDVLLDCKLSGYVLRIFAREIFYVKTLERGKFDAELEKKFQKLPNQLVRISEFIRIQTVKPILESDDLFFLFASWRDFLVSMSRFEPFALSTDVKNKVYLDLLYGLNEQLKLSASHSVIAMFVDMAIMVFTRWSNPELVSDQHWKDLSTDLLHIVNQRKEELSFGFLISVGALLSQALSSWRAEVPAMQRVALSDWMPPLCTLVTHSLRVLEKLLSQKTNGNEFKLVVVMVSCLTSAVGKTISEAPNWLPVLRSSLIIESLTSLLSYLLHHKRGFELAQTIVSTFIGLSTTTATASLLQAAQVIDHINLSLQSVYSDPEDEMRVTENPNRRESIAWIKVYHSSLRLTSSLLVILKHHFIEIAVNFASVHLTRIQGCFVRLRTSPTTDLAEEALHAMYLLQLLTDYKDCWKLQHLISYETVVTEVSQTCYTITALLVRPTLLQYYLEHPSIQGATAPRSTRREFGAGMETPGPHETHPIDKSMKRSESSETGRESPTKFDPKFQAFLKLLSLSLSFLSRVNPTVLEVLASQGVNNEGNRLKLDINFTRPDIDPCKPASFGSLVYCVNLCVRLITKSEKCCSPNTTPATDDPAFGEARVAFILETSLSILVSQALVAQLTPDVSLRDKQMIARELKSEMTLKEKLLSNSLNARPFPEKLNRRATFCKTTAGNLGPGLVTCYQ